MVAESEGCGLEETQGRACDRGTSAVSPVKWKQPRCPAGVPGGCGHLFSVHGEPSPRDRIRAAVCCRFFLFEAWVLFS